MITWSEQGRLFTRSIRQWPKPPSGMRLQNFGKKKGTIHIAYNFKLYPNISTNYFWPQMNLVKNKEINKIYSILLTLEQEENLLVLTKSIVPKIKSFNL